MSNEIRYFKRVFVLFFIGLTAIFGFSLYWNISRTRAAAVEFAKVEGYASYNIDVLVRRWASMHGGLYVPPTEQYPPNPYLTYIDDRDVVTSDGRILTLVNPAYLTRQLHELGDDQYGVKGHITSLKPIRPENKADEWEVVALTVFEKGDASEYSSLVKIDGKEFLRYMKPMITEQACLKCHEHQGYKVGNIRGGVSVSVPMESYYNVAGKQISRLLFAHILIYITVMLISIYAYRALFREMQKRNLAQIKVAESDRLKTAFLRNMSHEIRTPLNSIMGFSELISNPDSSPEERETYASVLCKNSNHLIDVVTDVLTVSSIETNQIKTQKQKVNINEVVGSLCERFRGEAERKGLEFSIILPLPDNQTEINTDEEKLSSILCKITDNALKFTSKGKIEIGYNLVDSFFEFYVKDTGSGIEPEVQKVIFEMFRQGDSKLNRKYEGSGLGLAIAKAYTEILGGEIWVNSTPGKGSEFYFTIPVL